MKEMPPFFKKQQLIKCHLLKTSSDPEVRMLYEARTIKEKELAKSGPLARNTKNCWRPCVELEKLLSEVKHNSMFGCGVRSGNDSRGLGYDTKLQKKKSKQAAERATALEILDEKIDGLRYTHATRLAHFAEWCKWDEIMAQDKLWQTAIYDSSDTLFQWIIKAIEDQCPSSQLLKVRKKVKHATCTACSANIVRIV